MKAEDKFYFGKPGKPERFAKPQFRSVKLYNGYLRIDVNQGSGWERYDTTHENSFDGLKDYERGWEKAYSRGLRWSGGSWRIPTNKFSSPGQPERFAANGWQTIEAYMQVLAEEFGTPRGKEAAQVMMRAAESLGGNAPAALRTAIRTAATSKNATDRGRAIGQIEDMLESASFSRPGQPDKFDASSLNRGTFAEASTSPMLGKLLSEKVMPEGGWRAVETGGGALVISFEDADLARDFGRRVATKGYNATSPVQAIGRYWNVEVKNG